MNEFAVFLRGVTPTGKNKVPMAALRAVLECSGYSHVRTYIQSGNVILRSEEQKSDVEFSIQDLIKTNFGGDIPCVAKTLNELGRVLKKNPFPIKLQKQIYFTMLKEKPDKKKLADLLLLDFSPDRVEVIGDVVYTCYKTTLSDSKFHNNFYERKMSSVATTRNFNTMLKVFELLKEK